MSAFVLALFLYNGVLLTGNTFRANHLMLITEDDIYFTSQILDFLSENDKALSFRKHTIRKGEPIFQQGQEITDIIFITEGAISVARSSRYGRRYQVGTFNHNGFLGLMELFSGKPCFYSVKAESDCEGFIMNGAIFAELICQTPILAAHTFKHLTSKWYLSVERMSRNILHSITYCVIDDLLQFHSMNPEKDYIVNKSLECERLGTSLRVYNRILKQLNDSGAISVTRKSIRIINLDKLEATRLKESEKQ
ncbi:Crp/Fnr family transcriptional regulator [Vibrio splendidus]|uniref:Crp/Fnr family transcriptional regulator n=1 Tax=Vibrio splendidus TaxID=29497 RepID=UPI001F53B016|nr:Crp/Fnr family transcriptional regulator [Vibrio splendidus]